ncbi:MULTISPECIES: S1 RNA-binding domain-containing protein [Streptomyces]|uniref:S1 RNA-binding domain-containing protein n=1 Tax=Streptomyces katrae TaxID=68223 RepID=A0ABT7GVU8_9ACTN|nr:MULTISPECIES: S1 RNA-binding domain-containing protein [Streptomyces]MDK9497753.1 S1 RNA-binding domain-containing protein [Streptomyces katrae]GLX18868.1 hypothetical protein Slala01_25120 [Streptomyces lavendulae subsp. lavendulae]GLX29210.1 hypothetical protein Slala02_50300 [Streptomyces lavendulae subsp. lavendulae]
MTSSRPPRWNPGEVCQGKVIDAADFGLVIDLGGDIGVVTPANLSWLSVDHPSEVAENGQLVTAVVLSTDPYTRQVSLSMKTLTRDPLAEFARSKFDSEVNGTVSKVTPIGAFAKTEEGVIGLIENSRASNGCPEFQVGDPVTVRVIHMNMTSRRVKMTLVERRATASE